MDCSTLAPGDVCEFAGNNGTNFDSTFRYKLPDKCIDPYLFSNGDGRIQQVTGDGKCCCCGIHIIRKREAKLRLKGFLVTYYYPADVYFFLTNKAMWEHEFKTLQKPKAIIPIDLEFEEGQGLNLTAPT